MYQRYPGQARSREPSGNPAPPPSIIMAVRFMYAGAVASLIGIAVAMATAGKLRSQIAKLAPKLTPAQVASAEHVEIAFIIIAGLIAVAAWLWMASACKAGKSWARLISTVLFAIETFRTIGTVAGGLVPGAGATRFYEIVVWLIGLAAIVLLWQRSSSEYLRGTAVRG